MDRRCNELFPGAWFPKDERWPGDRRDPLGLFHDPLHLRTHPDHLVSLPELRSIEPVFPVQIVHTDLQLFILPQHGEQSLQLL